jgi:hypothetical protein
MVICDDIEIQAPLSVVWRVFSRMEDWRDWNTVCRNCCYLEGDRMATETCFQFEIAPFFVALKVRPRIVSCAPEREVTWQGGRFGVRAAHTFRFVEVDGGVRLISEEVFQGPLLALGRLVGIPQRLHRLTREMMQGIKAHAEACAA